LARKARAKNVVCGDVRDSDTVNVAMWLFAKIRLVGLLAEPVVVGRENAFSARSLKSDAKPADAAEQINAGCRISNPGRMSIRFSTIG